MGGVLVPQPVTIWKGFEAQYGLPEKSILNALLNPENLSNFELLERGQITLPDFLALFVKPDESVVESCRVGMRKPDPAIYRHTLSLLQCEPQNAIFLDDIGQNLKPARAMGIHTIKVVNEASALKDLEAALQLPLRGYVPGTTAVRPGFEIPLQNFIGYAKASMPIRVEGEEISLRQFSHGQSNPTYLWTVGPKRFVLRKKPPGKLLLKAHMIEREFRVMSAIRPFGVPVPEPIHLCEDPSPHAASRSIIGTPFFVMGFANGVVYKRPTLPDMSPSQRARLYSGMVDVLAKIHGIDVDKAGLSNFGPKGDYLERNLKRWVRQYEQSKTEDVTAIDDLARWLGANMPPSNEQRTTLVHGDFRLDNLLFDQNSLNITAVLDWEISTLGDPLTDVATCLFAHYTPDDFMLLAGMRDCNVSELGIPTAEQFVNDYCRLAGIVPISPRAWTFYVAFVAFRYAAIVQGVYKRALLGSWGKGLFVVNSRELQKADKEI